MNVHKAAKNAAALTASNLSSKLITGLVAIFLTRYLGPDAYGSYSIAVAFAGTFVIFAELGLSQLLVQEGSRQPASLPVYFGNALALKALLALAAYALMLNVMGSVYSPLVCELVVIAGFGTACNAIAQTVYNYYQAIEEMARAAVFQFLTAVLIAGTSLVMILASLGVRAVVFSQSAVYVLVLVALYLALRGKIKLQPDFKTLPHNIWQALPFGAHRMFYYLYLQSSILLLSFAGESVSEYEIGLYAAPYRLVQMLLFLPSTLTSAIYPILYQQGEKDKDAHRLTTEKLFKVLVGVGLPGSTLLCTLATPMIHWLFGEAYAASVPVFVIVVWLLALECLSFSLGDVLTTTNRQTQRMLVQCGALLLVAVAMLPAYSRFGLSGIAATVVIVEVLVFLAYYLLARSGGNELRLFRQLPVLLLANAFLAALAALLGQYLHPMLAAAFAGCLYLGILAGVDRDFRQLLTIFFHRRKGKRS